VDQTVEFVHSGVARRRRRLCWLWGRGRGRGRGGRIALVGSEAGRPVCTHFDVRPPAQHLLDLSVVEVFLVAGLAVGHALPHGKCAAANVQQSVATDDVSSCVEYATAQAVFMKDFAIQVHSILGES
jgi:hypothetical protein